MNILHTESATGWGGQERRILRVMTHLSPKKFTTALVCQPNSTISKKAMEKNIPVFQVPMKNSLDIFAIYRIAKIIKENDIHIVHSHSSIDSWVASIAARISTKKPYIVRTRHLGGKVKNKLVYTLLADKIITLGKSTTEYLNKEKNIHNDKIVCIPTGININNYNPELVNKSDIRSKLAIPVTAPVIGTVSVLRMKKGHRYLLEAGKKIVEIYPDLKIIIVGDGPQRENLTNLVKKLNLGNNVVFVGYREDIVQFLSIMDVFVFPSLEEAFGTALLEAMTVNIPVIASNTGGIIDIVIDKKTGLLVPPADADAIALSVITLLKDQNYAAKIAQRGRELVYKSYTTEAMVRKIENLYEGIVHSA